MQQKYQFYPFVQIQLKGNEKTLGKERSHMIKMKVKNKSEEVNEQISCFYFLPESFGFGRIDRKLDKKERDEWKTDTCHTLALG